MSSSHRAATSATSIVAPQPPLAGALAHRRPRRAHGIERHHAGAGVAQVADQLAEDVGLIGIADAAMLLLDDGLGEDVDPRPVDEPNAA
jgi:hypothetical protein